MFVAGFIGELVKLLEQLKLFILVLLLQLFRLISLGLRSLAFFAELFRFVYFRVTFTLLS